jgi:5-methylcytosine-specific restriction protein A
MKHARICPCGYRVAGGTLCACQQRRQAARPNANARGYGTDWQAVRSATPHTPCTGCTRPWKAGFHLDHVKARKAGGTDDASNLHWLCHSCHSRKTAKKDGGFGHPTRMPGVPPTCVDFVPNSVDTWVSSILTLASGTPEISSSYLSPEPLKSQ